MPQNKSLKPVTLPMDLKFGQEPVTEFLNNLEALKVELIDYPDPDRAKRSCWSMVKSTWADTPEATDASLVSDKELSQNLEDMLCFRALPTPLETMGFTFKLSGITMQDVTHIVRHRTASFSAQCTGDRDLRNDPAAIPEAVQNSPEYLERWKRIVNESKQLYADMVDDKNVSMMDARIILPKCMTTFYHMRMNIKDLIGFIKQRQDLQIQPSSDNILAALMARELLKVFPEASAALNFNSPDMHYIRTFRVKKGDEFVSLGTNLYHPEPKNDTFEYHPDDSIYQCRREELRGTHPPDKETTIFQDLWNDIMSDIDSMTENYRSWIND
jgi:thymidylate synthase (FAD)